MMITWSNLWTQPYYYTLLDLWVGIKIKHSNENLVNKVVSSTVTKKYPGKMLSQQKHLCEAKIVIPRSRKFNQIWLVTKTIGKWWVQEKNSGI